MKENKKVIGVVQVQQDLKDGLTREDIADKYGITSGECKLLFQHPELKGKKTIKRPSFVIVQDARIAEEGETKTEENDSSDSITDSNVEKEETSTIEDTISAETEEKAEIKEESEEEESEEEESEEEVVEDTKKKLDSWV